MTSGSLNSNSTQSSNQREFPSLCPVVMHSPVTESIPRTLDRFLPLHPSPLPATATGHTQSALHSTYNVWSDRTLALKTLGEVLVLHVSKCQAVTILLPPNLGSVAATHRASPGHAQSREAQCEESLLLVTMLYFVMPCFVLEMLNTPFLPFSILLKHLSGLLSHEPDT